MSVKCKHGLELRFCALCRDVAEVEPLPTNALRYTRDGQPVIVLRSSSGSNKAEVLRLEVKSPFSTLDVISLGEDDTSFESFRQDVINLFHELALRKGVLFHPKSALTTREQSVEGPTHCYHCWCNLSYENGSLGCMQCQYYVCRCGRCLCGQTGVNYLSQWFSQLPALPIPREERLEFVRVVNYCASAAQAAISGKPIEGR